MSESHDQEQSTTAERITLSISVVILLSILAVAIWSNMQTGQDPPDIVVEADIENVRETDSGFYVPITIKNNGGMTAQDAVIAGELDLGDGEPETAEITIAYLAGGEEEAAELIFSAHPNDGDFSVVPISYLQP